jgi:hypothetical protein
VCGVLFAPEGAVIPHCKKCGFNLRPRPLIAQRCSDLNVDARVVPRYARVADTRRSPHDVKRAQFFGPDPLVSPSGGKALTLSQLLGSQRAYTYAEPLASGEPLLGQLLPERRHLRRGNEQIAKIEIRLKQV